MCFCSCWFHFSPPPLLFSSSVTFLSNSCSVPVTILWFSAELSVFLRCLPIPSLFCAICLSELRFQFYSFPSEAPGGHGGSSQPPSVSLLGPLSVPLPQEHPGLPLPPVEDVPSLVLGSVSSVSPVLVHCCHWGVVLWCLHRRERETGADAALKEPHRHL